LLRELKYCTMTTTPKRCTLGHWTLLHIFFLFEFFSALALLSFPIYKSRIVDVYRHLFHLPDKYYIRGRASPDVLCYMNARGCRRSVRTREQIKITPHVEMLLPFEFSKVPQFVSCSITTLCIWQRATINR
jgi:hypothetical protein